MLRTVVNLDRASHGVLYAVLTWGLLYELNLTNRHHRCYIAYSTALPVLYLSRKAKSNLRTRILFFNIYFFFIDLFIGLRRVLVAASFCCHARAPEHAGSVVAVHGLTCPVACGILAPQPGIEPASHALEGGFLTTGPPGKSQD